MIEHSAVKCGCGKEDTERMVDTMDGAILNINYDFDEEEYKRKLKEAKEESKKKDAAILQLRKELAEARAGKKE